MISLLLSDIAEALDGELIGEDKTIVSISTDSRNLKQGDVFLALKGPNFDGHRFIEQAVAQECSAVIVEQRSANEIAQIVVKNTHTALGHIGAYVKEQVAPKTVGITGSSGKTTVKEMTTAILSRLGNVLATKGNFNNDIGVPLTLLRLNETHDFAVIEMGANHIGEIEKLCEIAQPNFGIITNIGKAHLEGFGSLKGVIQAKTEIYKFINNSGDVILPS